MGQADEDEARWLLGDFDDDDPYFDELDFKRSGYGRSPGRDPFEEPRRIQVDIPGSVKLSSLSPGETFRFANAMSVANVYMVIQSEDLDDSVVNYVLLNTGKVYKSRPSKSVVQVDVRMSIDTASGRVRV